MTPILTRGELAAALAQPRAFLFLYVNWATQARHSLLVARQVVAEWQAEHPDAPAPGYMVDVSDECGEVWDALVEWVTAEGRSGQLLMSGVGPLLWVRDGRVVLHVPGALSYGAAKLAAASRSAFAAERDH